MPLYHYVVVKKTERETRTIDGVWSVEKPIVTIDDYREFKRQVSGEETLDGAKKWCCYALSRLDT